jgi:hypothetical protein
MGGRGHEDIEDILRRMLRDLFEIDHRGARGDKLARVHGYTDGYMRALVDVGIATQKELLTIVLDERRRAAEPPRRMELEIPDATYDHAVA